jgi:F0F1-type ATP synthase delta subunit
MTSQSEAFMRKMLEFLPSTEASYRESIEFNGEVLETVIIESVFMPVVIELIRQDQNIDLLERIFEYFEEVSNDEDTHLINIFSITVLEILGNEKNILRTAQKYMGPRTTKLQIEADKALGRKV